MRFAVYKLSHQLSNHLLVRRNYIVLKNNDIIVGWTDFHRYIDTNKRKLFSNVVNCSNNKAVIVCQFLNFIFFEKYHIDKLGDVTIEMAKDFLNNYAMRTLPCDSPNTHRTEETIDNTIRIIMDFLYRFSCQTKEAALDPASLFKREKTYVRSKRKYAERMVPTFSIVGDPTFHTMNRDITTKAFKVIYQNIKANHPELLMLFACGAFAGMRPSECCNVRREDSSLGQGIRIEYLNGKPARILINLTKELCLRSDGKRVGSIKKERMQRVFPVFIPEFYDCYQTYLEFIKDKQYESDYGALNLDCYGMAMTYDSYRYYFKKAVKECIPLMLKSEDIELVSYAVSLKENMISPHVLRHWFTVQLVLLGENEATIMYERGDRSPESAITYLKNKGELVKELKRTENDMFEYLMKEADEKWKI